MIQGVIFDMDGLMFDTERIWATLWEPALAGLGLSYKEGLDEAARGTAGDSMRAVLRRFYGPDCDPDRIIEALHEQGETAFLAPPPKKPGLDEILAWLVGRFVMKGVARHTARFTDEGYVIANQRGEQSFDYSSVQALCEDGRYFFLMLSRQQGNLFDKQGFHTGTADQFRAFLERKTGQTMKKL